VDVAYHFDPASTAGPAVVTEPARTTRDRALVVGTGTAFRVERVRLSLAPQAAELVHGMAVRLRVPATDATGDLTRDVITLDAAHPDAVWYRRLPLESAPHRVLARADWIDAHGASHEGDEVEVVGGDFVAVGPVRDELPVRVLPAVDWTTVRQLYVEIRHADGDLVQDHELVFSADPGPGGRQITLALVDPDNRGYQWRKVVVRVDGTSSSTEWAEADVMLLAVDDAPPSAAAVRVTWLGDRADALAMRADFYHSPGPGRADEQVASALLQPTEPDTVVQLPLDPDGRLRYRYEVRRIDDTGETLVRTGEDSARLLVVRTR
jgi:hypothetical protein